MCSFNTNINTESVFVCNRYGRRIIPTALVGLLHSAHISMTRFITHQPVGLLGDLGSSVRPNHRPCKTCPFRRHKEKKKQGVRWGVRWGEWAGGWAVRRADSQSGQMGAFDIQQSRFIRSSEYSVTACLSWGSWFKEGGRVL